MKKIFAAGILLFGLLFSTFQGPGQTGSSMLGITSGGQSVLGISKNGIPLTPIAPPTACIPCPDMPLPIELISFIVERLDIAEVELRWHTATELENRGFEILRRFDNGRHFEKIGFVAGKGTTDWPSFYDYLDLNAFSGTTYYQFKQVDYNGNFIFSEIRSVPGYSTDKRLTIYPNPAYDRIIVEITGLSEPTDATVNILDAKGVCLLSRVRQFSNVQPRLEINGLGKYPEGIYFIYLVTEDWTKFRKFVHGQ